MSNRFHLDVPPLFSFRLCCEFLQRSPRELLHQCDGRIVTKAVNLAGRDLLIQVEEDGKSRIAVTVLNEEVAPSAAQGIGNYVKEWFDMETDLKPFYKMAKTDPLLSELVRKYKGYRIVGQPDLYESLVWAVLGQQINLGFAYTLKGRFVEKYGRSVLLKGKPHYIFPRPSEISMLNPEELLPLQFSRQKAKYTVEISQAFEDGRIAQSHIQRLPFVEAKEALMKIKGIGNWTANYALMKTFRYPDAFPLEDAGLHNAIRNLKKMKAKPTVEQVKRIFKRYRGWEAYATLYLWKSLASS